MDSLFFVVLEALFTRSKITFEMALYFLYELLFNLFIKLITPYRGA